MLPAGLVTPVRPNRRHQHVSMTSCAITLLHENRSIAFPNPIRVNMGDCASANLGGPLALRDVARAV